MKKLTKYELNCGKIMVSEIGNTRVTLYKEHNVYQLKSNNVLGSGIVWEQFYDYEKNAYKNVLNQFKKLVIIQKGIKELITYKGRI